MARLIYTALASLDGYVADADGNFAWAAPDEEVHAFINELERPIGTHLYGRRLYEVMAGWETAETRPNQSPAMLEFAHIWQAAGKIVYSSTLANVRTARTRIERRFEADAVHALKAAARRDLSVGGPSLAATAFKAGLVDECHLLLFPNVVGGGTPALPRGLQVSLELLDERRFTSGVVHAHYAVAR
jgi:dihydrofolate reductase